MVESDWLLGLVLLSSIECTARPGGLTMGGVLSSGVRAILLDDWVIVGMLHLNSLSISTISSSRRSMRSSFFSLFA